MAVSRSAKAAENCSPQWRRKDHSRKRHAMSVGRTVMRGATFGALKLCLPFLWF